MHGSATVGWLVTVLCAVTGGACLLRASGAGGMRRRAAESEALMGLGMAGMSLSGSLAVAVPPLVFVMLFGAVGAWELTLLRGTPEGRPAAVHHLHHVVGAAAMVYMALAMPTAHGGGASGHAHAGGAAAAGLPVLTGVLLAYFAVYVLWSGPRVLPSPAAAVAVCGGGAGPLSRDGAVCDRAVEDRAERFGAVRDLPGLAAACRLSMGTGMLAMLLML
jgi:hypothetical protein